MLTHPFACAAVLVLSACASGPSIIEQDIANARRKRDTASEREAAIQAAQEGLMDCHLRRWRVLDDRISDAATVAKVLANACQREGAQLLHAYTIGIDDGQARAWRELFPEFEIDLATQSVLVLRRPATR